MQRRWFSQPHFIKTSMDLSGKVCALENLVEEMGGQGRTGWDKGERPTKSGQLRTFGRYVLFFDEVHERLRRLAIRLFAFVEDTLRGRTIEDDLKHLKLVLGQVAKWRHKRLGN